MIELSRLAWRCRRGTRELDILLRGFLDVQYASLSDAEREDFVNLLELQDPVLIEWFWGQSQPPEDLRPLIARIREHASTVSKART